MPSTSTTAAYMMEEGHGGARVSAPGASGVERRPTCCVYMEPWTCDDAHGICCIPCGHVYGRSCLERWLHRCGDTSAKCPQCGSQFTLEHIINLYAPANLWDGCFHGQAEIMLLLAHAAACPRDRSSCQYSKCRTLKALFKHGKYRKIRVSNDCGAFKKL